MKWRETEGERRRKTESKIEREGERQRYLEIEIERG